MQASNNGGITLIWFLFNSAGSGSDRDQRKQLKIFLSVYLCINLYYYQAYLWLSV